MALYWYGATGSVLDETSSNGTLVSEYIFFNGKRVARRDADNTVKYYFADNLGSASVITNSTGAMPPLAESDYYPYGGEIPIVSGDSNHYKFTGKERDAESGLDNFGARFFTSNLGRFMTPDWAARPTAVPYAVFGDPQSLNLYTYVENSPVNRVDADGHYCVPAGLQSWCSIDPMPGEKEAVQTNKSIAAAQNKQTPQTVVFSDRANATPSQPGGKGAAAERTVDYQAGKMDKNGHIDSHDIDRNAKLTLHEKLDPNSKTHANIEKEPHTETGSYKDLHYVPAGGSFRVLRDWSVNGQPANVLDIPDQTAYRYELLTNDANASPPIKTEYTNTPPF
jgi:RHS repeat-associated protein